MIYESPHPLVELPECSVWEKGAFSPLPTLRSEFRLLDADDRRARRAVWSNPRGARDDETAVIDGPTGRKLR